LQAYSQVFYFIFEAIVNGIVFLNLLLSLLSERACVKVEELLHSPWKGLYFPAQGGCAQARTLSGMAYRQVQSRSTVSEPKLALTSAPDRLPGESLLSPPTCFLPTWGKSRCSWLGYEVWSAALCNSL
jgi:hypothetical protein